VVIYENKNNEPRRLTFNGWFVASDPALNPFDSSTEDIWLLKTIIPKEKPPEPETPSENKRQKADEVVVEDEIED